MTAIRLEAGAADISRSCCGFGEPSPRQAPRTNSPGCRRRRILGPCAGLGVTLTDHLDGDHRELMGAEVRFSSRDAGVVGRIRIRRAGVVGVAG